VWAPLLCHRSKGAPYLARFLRDVGDADVDLGRSRQAICCEAKRLLDVVTAHLPVSLGEGQPPLSPKLLPTTFILAAQEGDRFAPEVVSYADRGRSARLPGSL
jgi:hypothetical protein